MELLAQRSRLADETRHRRALLPWIQAAALRPSRAPRMIEDHPLAECPGNGAVWIFTQSAGAVAPMSSRIGNAEQFRDLVDAHATPASRARPHANNAPMRVAHAEADALELVAKQCPSAGSVVRTSFTARFERPFRQIERLDRARRASSSNVRERGAARRRGKPRPCRARPGLPWGLAGPVRARPKPRRSRFRIGRRRHDLQRVPGA